jgi:hypothetical protein
MNLVSPLAVATHKNLVFNFSNTLRNQIVNLSNFSSGGYVIDINGEVYSSGAASGESATVVVIGGSDKFIHEKANRLQSTFYMSEPQKVVLYKIIKELSENYDSASITSNNEKLEQALTALYRNNCG